MNKQLRFSERVAGKLGYYVYRLIDPRNGETFYVGKGTGNRIFAHVKDELDTDADVMTEKLKKIRAIRRDGIDVIHVVHRHGMDEETAFEVEAALIDAYPEANNLMGGQASEDRGCMHAKQIIERYEAKEVVFRHSAILINVNKSAIERDNIYEAVRYAWRLDPKKAQQAEVVLAVDRGLVIGVFIAEKWLPATVQNFPAIAADRTGRCGFVGHNAPDNIANLYLHHRVPDNMRKRGSANPIRYADPQSAETS
jgi:hypothetical protein